MSNKIAWPTDPQAARKAVEGENRVAEMRLELGLLGGLFGSRENASPYLALIVLIIASGASLIFAYHEPAIRPEVAKAFIALIPLVVGYMFGSMHRRSS